MLFDIFRDGFSVGTVMNLMARVFVVFCTLPIHEYAHALVATKLCPSKRDARTNVTGGGVSVNDEKITDPMAMIEIGEYAIIKKGKKNYHKITL